MSTIWAQSWQGDYLENIYSYLSRSEKEMQKNGSVPKAKKPVVTGEVISCYYG
ncbi:MAG: hypothetical protein RR336_02100 [Oscillospiraceae bacterium]